MHRRSWRVALQIFGLHPRRPQSQHGYCTAQLPILTNGVVRDEAVDVHLARLADAVAAVLSLRMHTGEAQSLQQTLVQV